MASEKQNMSEQDISIKAREHELYVRPKPDLDIKPVKSFPVYLRETPAEPFSRGTKVVLWIVGTVVALLFMAALWRLSHSHLNRRATRSISAQTKSNGT